METKTLSPAQYLSQRSTELDEIEAELNERFAWLRVERDRLARMYAGIEEFLVNSEHQQHQNTSTLVSVPKFPKPPIRTIKEAVLEVLSECEDGLSAHNILPRVNAILGSNYSRTSLSPQLSRLRHEGSVKLEAGTWKINPRMNEASGGEPARTSPEGSSLYVNKDQKIGQGGDQ